MDNFTIQTLTLFLLIFSLTFLALQKWRKCRNTGLQSQSQSQSQTLAPPSPPKLPIIGHLHLLTDMPHHSFADLSARLGPIFHLQLGRVAAVVVSSARLARLVLRTHDHVFASRPQFAAAEYLSLGGADISFSPYGPSWRQARRICVAELLSPKRVNSFQLVREEEVTRFLTAVSARSGTVVNMTREFFAFSNDVLCRVAFGKRLKERQKLHLAEVMSETQKLLAGFNVGDFFPGRPWKWVSWVSGLKKRLQKNMEDLSAVCEEIIDEHLGKTEMDNKEDFVDVLIRVRKNEDLEVPMTDDNLKAILLDMFVAGTDTSAAILEWTMAELARHPTVMKKAQDEVRKIAPSGSWQLSESHLQHLPYIKAVIKETMRLHPPVPLLIPRESMDRCILDGYEIPAKTRIFINTYAIGRDPESWENPLEFNPERFCNEGFDYKDQDYRFLPAGGGRRGCPGFGFGLASVETALARLLYHFDWALPEGVGADDVDLGEVFGLATKKKTALVLVPTANKDYEFRG